MRGPAFAAIIVANVLGGFSYYWTFRAIEIGLPEAMIAGLRSLLASIVLGSWLLATSGIRLKFSRGEWVRLGIIGVFATGVPLVLGIIGTYWSTPGNASILILIEPAAILFFSWVLLAERIRPSQIFGLGLGAIGAYVVFRGDIDSFQALLLPTDLFDGRHAQGNMLLILHSILWGLYSPLIKPLASKYRAVDLSFVVMVMSIIPILPLLAWEVRSWEPVEAVGEALLYVFLLGIVVSVGATVLWNFSLQHLRASTIAPFVFLQPVVGVISDVVLLGKPMANGAVYGGVAIAVAVLLVSYPRREKKRPDADSVSIGNDDSA